MENFEVFGDTHLIYAMIGNSSNKSFLQGELYTGSSEHLVYICVKKKKNPTYVEMKIKYFNPNKLFEGISVTTNIIC